MKSHLTKQNGSKAKMLMLCLVLCLLFLLPSEAWVQGRKPTTITEIVTYSGADREQLLYAGAKTKARSFGTLLLPVNRTRGWLKPLRPSIPA